MDNPQVDNKSLLDKPSGWIVSLIYSKEKKYHRYLIILMLVGFILRVIAALHLDVFADDMVYAEQSANIWHSKILSTNSHPALYYYLTDIAYKIFGYTTFASRFFPIIAGTLIILVVFLITRKLFNERVAICAAFFATFANFIIKLDVSEQSLLVFFFAFFAIYVGMLYLENKKTKYLVLTAILFGLANLSKYNGFFFLLGFLLFALYFIYEKKEKIFSKQNIKHSIIALLIIIIIALPFLAFNYFIYKQNGYLDFQFTKIFQTPKALQLYQGLGGIDTGMVEGLTNPKNYSNYNLLYRTDIILTLFALIGLGFFIYKKQKIPIAFIICFLVLPFILQSASSTLTKHFVFLHIAATIPAGYALQRLFAKTSKRYLTLTVLAILTILFVINLGNSDGSAPSYAKASAAAQLRSFVNNNVQSNDLIVFDSRIYTGQSYFLGMDHNLLNIHQFAEFYNYHNQIPPEQKTPVNIYFVECASDNCGWGNIDSINKSAEELFASISGASSSNTTIYSTLYEGNEFYGTKEKQARYTIYKVKLDLNQKLVDSTKSLNNFYYAPYLYLNMKDFVFNYETSGLGTMLDWLAHMVLYISIISALIAFILVFFFL